MQAIDVDLQHMESALAAILAADVAGYSRLMGVDEEGTLAALKAYRRELVDPKIAEHRGRIVKTTGDGALVEFASAVDAVRCAMGLMQLRVLKIDSPELTQFAAQLAVGKIYASGHGFVPQVRTAIYDRLLQFADPAPAPGLPSTWDAIDIGHLVIARDELAAGWWEAIVVARDGDMLTVRFRDYPKQAHAVLHRAALALLRPTAA